MVEDDDAVSRMTRTFLEIRGYTVIEARCAADAIQFVERQEETIDLVLTDVLMPGMKGRELVDQLSRLRPSLKVLYMSAYTEDDAISIGVLSPGTTFIEKPFSPDELAAKVRDVLNGDQRQPQPTIASAPRRKSLTTSASLHPAEARGSTYVSNEESPARARPRRPN